MQITTAHQFDRCSFLWLYRSLELSFPGACAPVSKMTLNFCCLYTQIIAL